MPRKRFWVLGPGFESFAAALERSGENYKLCAGDSVRAPEKHDGALDVVVILIGCSPRVMGLQHDDYYWGEIVRL